MPFAALGENNLENTPTIIVMTSMNGEQLLESCEKPWNNVASYNTCHAYIAGVIDTIYAIQAINNKKEFIDCYYKFYTGVSPNQQSRVIIKFLEDNPKLLNMVASSLIMTAFWSAFPIPKACEKISTQY